VEDRRRAAVDARDLQPSLHRDGCGVDYSRPGHRGFAIGAAGRVVRNGGDDRELCHSRIGTCVVLDIRDQRRSELEVDRMRDLADASVEGLLVCDGETIVSVNTSFSILTGFTTANLVGRKLESCVPDEVARASLLSRPNQGVETDLRQLDGTLTPVELILRPIVFGGRPHQVVAVRDLKAHKDAEEHIYFLAHHDALTGLINQAESLRDGREVISVVMHTDHPGIWGDSKTLLNYGFSHLSTFP